MKIIYTKHSREMLLLRNIAKEKVEKCIKNPDKILPGKENKKMYFKDFGINYLKVIVSPEKKGIVIITLHWIAKKRVKV